MIELIDIVGVDPAGRRADAGVKRIMLADKFVGFLFPNGGVGLTAAVSESELNMIEVWMEQHGKGGKPAALSAELRDWDGETNDDRES